MRLPMALAGGVLMAAALTGCGSNDSGSTTATKNKASDASDKSYCDAMTKASDDFFSDDDQVLADPEAAFARMHELAQAAPDEVRASWKQIDDAVQKVVNGLDDVGLTFTEMTDSFDGQTPDSATMAKLEKLGPVLEDMSSEDYAVAEKKVAAHAKKECGIDDLGSLGGASDASDVTEAE